MPGSKSMTLLYKIYNLVKTLILAASTFYLDLNKMSLIFPLYSYQEELTFFLQTFPSKSLITKAEVLTLSNIRQLQLYVYYTFPQEISQNNYQCLRLLLEGAISLYHDIPSHFYLLAPGDSPFKLVHLIKWIYPEVNLTFISFPLSGLGEGYQLDQLDAYLRPFLTNVPLDKLILLDHISQKITYYSIRDSIRRISNNPNYKLKKYNIEEYWGNNCDHTYSNLISDAEDSNVRCLPSYRLDTGLENNNNTLRCNAILALTYLLHLNQVKITPELPLPWPNRFNGKFLDLTYFDIISNEIVTKFVYINNITTPYPEDITLTIIPEGSLNSNEMNTFTGTFIKAGIVQVKTIEDTRPYLNNLIKVTYVNSFSILAWFENNNLDTGCGNPLPSTLFIRSMEIVPNFYSPFDMTPFIGSICQMTHLCNNKIITEEVYIVSISGQEIIYVPEEYFVSTYLYKSRYQINKNLVYSSRLTREKSSLSLAPCHCRVSYRYRNKLYQVEDDWKPEFNGQVYVGQDLVVIAPLIEVITQT